MAFKAKADSEKLSVDSETVVSETNKTDEASVAKEIATIEPIRVYVYVGPSVRGIVNNGSIMRGTRSEILTGIKQNAEARNVGNIFPKISKLLVADSDVAHAKEQLAAGDNGLSRAFKAVSGEGDE